MINIKYIHTIIDETIDDDVISKITHEKFFEILEKTELDIDKLSSKRKKNDYLPFHKFNFILKELHDTKRINITDSCIFLLTEMITMKDLMSCLNEENKYTLRVELAERNCISLKRSSLDTFMFKKKKEK